MIKQYQTIVDKGRGNCMQAAYASLLDKELNDVPNFIEFGNEWYSEIINYLKSCGYGLDKIIYNKKYNTLLHPTNQCFSVEKYVEEYSINKKSLNSEKGINGFFYATVLSPKYFNWKEGFNSTHAVIIDKNYNIIHDPNAEYVNILNYPLSNIIGFNGVIAVYIFNPINV